MQENYLLSRHFEIHQEKTEFGLHEEHNYAKFDWANSSLSLPTIYLFMNKKCRHFPIEERKSSHDVVVDDIADENIEDVLELNEEPKYNEDKAQSAMNECEKYAGLAELDSDSNDDLENPYSETSCKKQRVLQRKIVDVLKSERLARLAYKGLPNEAILRRIMLDRSANRIRKLLSDVEWEESITSKLHMNLIGSLSKTLLSIYLDVIQTLMSKVPILMESMLRTHMSRLNISANEALDLLLSTPWCPVYDHISKQALPMSPSSLRPSFIIINQIHPSKVSPEHKRRWKLIGRQLSAVGSVHWVLRRIHDVCDDPDEMLDACLRRIEKKVQEVKSGAPDNPVVLLGNSFTSLLACEISNIERVHAVVCLGFPMSDQQTEEAKFCVPTLFFVGEDSRDSSVEKLEMFRATIKATTGLVVVGGADEHLKVDRYRQMVEEVIQPMADRCILEKMAEFLSFVLQKQGFH